MYRYSADLTRVLESLFEPHLEKDGVELVELAVAGTAGRHILRIYVDRPGGITVGECADVSRSLADLLDTHNPVAGSYVLEVSSPGLTRPLKRQRDYERAVGKEVRLVVEGRGVIVGTLTAVDGDALTVEADGQADRVPLPAVTRANLHFEFGSGQ